MILYFWKSCGSLLCPTPVHFCFFHLVHRSVPTRSPSVIKMLKQAVRISWNQHGVLLLKSRGAATAARYERTRIEIWWSIDWKFLACSISLVYSQDLFAAPAAQVKEKPSVSPTPQLSKSSADKKSTGDEVKSKPQAKSVRAPRDQRARMEKKAQVSSANGVLCSPPPGICWRNEVSLMGERRHIGYLLLEPLMRRNRL